MDDNELTERAKKRQNHIENFLFDAVSEIKLLSTTELNFAHITADNVK